MKGDLICWVIDMGRPCGLDPTQDSLDASLIEDMSLSKRRESESIKILL